MNQDQVTSIVRQVLLAVGGGLVTKGYVDSGTMTAIVGALAIIVGSVWAIYTRRNTGLVASAAGVPDVHKIITDPITADSVPSAKVVGRTGV